MKRGQITVFIILGIVILISVLAIYALTSKLTVPNQQPTLQTEPIVQFVESCITKTAEDGIDLLSKQGGYFETKDPYQPILGIPYYFYEGDDLGPTKDTLESELENYLNSELFFCTKNFVDFKKQGITVGFEEPSSIVTIFPEKIRIKVNYPLSIRKVEMIKEIETFSVELPSRLGTFHSISRSIVEEQQKDPGTICISCLFLFAQENDVAVILHQLGNDETTIELYDEKSATSRLSQFHFANKYHFVPEPEHEEIILE